MTKPFFQQNTILICIKHLGHILHFSLSTPSQKVDFFLFSIDISIMLFQKIKNFLNPKKNNDALFKKYLFKKSIVTIHDLQQLLNQLDFNEKDSDGLCPLHFFILYHSKLPIKLQKEHWLHLINNTDLGITDSLGHNTLMLFIMNNSSQKIHLDINFYEFLIKKTDLLHKDSYENNALIYSFLNNKKESLFFSGDIFSYLLDNCKQHSFEALHTFTFACKYHFVQELNFNPLHWQKIFDNLNFQQHNDEIKLNPLLCALSYAYTQDLFFSQKQWSELINIYLPHNPLLTTIDKEQLHSEMLQCLFHVLKDYDKHFFSPFKEDNSILFFNTIIVYLHDYLILHKDKGPFDNTIVMIFQYLNNEFNFLYLWCYLNDEKKQMLYDIIYNKDYMNNPCFIHTNFTIQKHSELIAWPILKERLSIQNNVHLQNKEIQCKNKFKI